MPIPGYDPDDIDDKLEGSLTDDQLESHLSDAELEAYRDGDESLIDLLEEDEVRRIVDDEDPPLDASD
ncbi:hypothetical protein [Halopiger goleimassiliensis]|uniref:hypothetical protein n=1 Tax=Halopiger goleimassiliensis TaxID=1293048 RepID=UPI0006776C58|nr:hypothetical protein [Halopiger goleimassiliensis]